MANIIQKAVENNKPVAQKQQSINSIMTGILDGEGIRKRFDEILGKRSPQFISSIVSLVNADSNLRQAMIDSPMTVIQSALTAATFDLPISPSLGYAYIIPFNKKDKQTGTYKKEAQFILGYRGMMQLCLRTGAYERVPDAVDVREGELVSYDRLTGDCEFAWVEDEDAREKLPVIGYAGYFRLKNGASKTLYMTVNQIKAHEERNRKGSYQSNLWKDDFDSMAKKTVIRRLCSKYGLMSIDYLKGDADTVQMAQAAMESDIPQTFDGKVFNVDNNTGEVVIENA